MKILLFILLFAFVFVFQSKSQNYLPFVIMEMAPDSTIHVRTHSIHENDDGHIFACNWQGLEEFDGSTWTSYTFYSFLPPAFTGIQQIFTSCSGIHHDLWVGASENVFFRDSTGAWSAVDTSLIPSDVSPVSQVTSDALGNIWMYAVNYSNNHRGIVKFDGNAYTLFDSTNSPLGALSGQIKCAKNGVLWASLSPNRLCRYDGNSWTVFDSISSGFHFYINSLFTLDDFGNLYLVGDSNNVHYIFQYDGNNWNNVAKIVDPPLGQPEDPQEIKVTKNGDIWLNFYGTAFELARFDASGSKFFYTGSSLNGSQDISTIHCAKNGAIWAGVENGLPSNKYEIFLFNENGFNSLKGKVYYDTNQDGLFQLGELLIPDQLINISPQGFVTSSNSITGYQTNLPDTVGSYTVGLVVPQYWHPTNMPASYSVTQTNNNEITDSLDFGLYPDALINDVSINFNQTAVRPGFNSFGYISYRNKGTTILSDTITLVLDNNQTYINSNDTPFFQSGNTIKWKYNNLVPFEKRKIMIEVLTSQTAVIGDTLLSNVSIGPVSSDSFPSDNNFLLENIVTGSFDPNSKEVNPKGSGPNGNILPNQELNYKINFQNTGNDTAFIVIIKDTLPVNADITTLNIYGSSHPFTYELQQGVLIFRFDYILLPDSNANEAASHGFVGYTISPKQGLTGGSVLNNTAYIFFDFNSYVKTNETINTIDFSPGLSETIKTENLVMVYPNPFTNEIQVVSKTTDRKWFVLYDSVAGKIAEYEFSNDCIITLNSQKKGIYIYRIFYNDGRSYSGKLIKI